MREFSTGFLSHIKSESTSLCWVWKLARADGVVLGFTDHDRDIVFDGIVFQAASGFTGADIESRIGFSLDNSAVHGLLNSDTLMKADIEAGVYDGAQIEIYRVNWQDVSEYGLIWGGNIGDIHMHGEAFEAELVGRSAALERSTGRVFARHCEASFGDAQCGLNISNFPQNTVCPKTFLACREDFSNSINFRGFPYLIGEDAGYARPRDGDRKDGSSRYKK